MQLHTLTEEDREFLATNEADRTVLAAGPWIKGPCEMPNRIVLRDNDFEFVVHSQTFSRPDGVRPHFHWGRYFPKSSPVALRAAWIVFDERCRVSLGFNSSTPST